MARLETFIQRGLLALLALMPFHAFLSVWFGHLFGHQAIIQAWKEALLVALGVATLMLIWRDRSRIQRLRQPWIMLAAGFAALAILVTLVTRPSLTTVAFGLKTDLEFLLAGIVAALVADTRFIRSAVTVTLVASGGVIIFGLAQAFILPPDFLTHFGYGPDTIVPYQHITLGTDNLRFGSTLGGPNQLGTYLILAICLGLATALRTRRWWLLTIPAGGVVVLAGTYSRSAWIGALIAVVITLIATTSRKLRRTVAWGLAGAGVLTLLALPLALKPESELQYFLLHSSIENHGGQETSDGQHASSLRDGSQAVIQAPLGHGLGTAGPATFHAGSINIIENYYLQIGYETGLLGMIMFLALLAALIYSLWRHAPTTPAALPVAAAVIGVSTVGLVLPSWTDSSTALITWTAAGAVAGLSHKDRNSNA